MELNVAIERNKWYRFICIFSLLFAMIFTVFTAEGQTETYTWNNVAIGGGGFVSGIITSKTKQDLMYARTDVGGAYRWDATNSAWIPLLDWTSEDQLGYQGVESIAIDPVETNKVYMLVGTSYFNNGKTAILRSSDYGNTFAITDVSSQFKAHGNGMGRQTGEKLQVDPNKTSILFCGTRSNGLFKSIDSGVSWSAATGLAVSTTTTGNGISFVVIDPSTGSSGSASQTLIAGVSQTGTNLYRSNDGGSTFTAISGAPTTLMPHRAVLASDRSLYITYVNAAGPWDITGAGQIWKYSLQTGTWTNVTPASFGGAFGGISIDPNNVNRLVASSINTYSTQGSSYGDQIFLSTNGGTSWVNVVSRGFSLDANGSPWISGNSIHWAGCVEFDPFDTKKAWIISGNGVFMTDNIDATTNVWKFVVKGLEETVPLDLVSIPNGPALSAIGDYDGFRHTDVTQYATIHTPRMGTTTGIAFAAQNPKIVLRTGQKKVNNVDVGELYYSTDMGISWTECAVSKGVKGNLAIAADGKTFLHTPESSNITYRSINNGASWTIVTGLSGSRPVADPVNPNKFYAYNYSTGSLLISTDGGASFAASGSSGSSDSKLIRTAPGKEGDIWVPLSNSGLRRSTDSGQNFVTVAGVTTCSAVGFGKEAPGKSYATVFIYGKVGGVLGIYRSIDEGATWVRVNDDNHQYGGMANGQIVLGDMNVYGRVYMSTAGRGIVYGESSNTCLPTLVVPNIKVNTDAIQQTSIISANEGDDIVFSPAPASGGSWSWIGPGSFTSTDREITFASMLASQEGIYSVQFTNANGCKSAWQTFTVNITPVVKSIIVKGQNNVSTIDTQSGTLQMIAEITPDYAANKTVTWSVNNLFAAINSSGVLTAYSNGVVTVRATAKDGSGVYGETAITISNQIVTAIDEPIEDRFGIYPNPVLSDLIIHNASSIKQISFIDTTGHQIFEINNNQDLIRTPLTNISKGIYILRLYDRNGSVYVKKIFKD